MNIIIIKFIIIAVIFLILLSLGSGLFFLFKDTSETKRTAKALTIRITLSISLFIALFLAFYFGLIIPHGIKHW